MSNDIQNYPKIKAVFFDFLYGSVGLKTFKNYLYDNIFQIEDIFNPLDYSTILESDYFNNSFDSDKLKSIIENYIDISEYRTWELIINLTKIVNKSEDYRFILKKLFYL